MSDLDQYMLKEIAFSGLVWLDPQGVEHSIVPTALLQRVTRQFDVKHIERELCGRAH